ncbi:MAG: hypothetical protein R3C19_10565 [Planctomycetaceae bacterium]
MQPALGTSEQRDVSPLSRQRGTGGLSATSGRTLVTMPVPG